jgi:hypothetical protein
LHGRAADFVLAETVAGFKGRCARAPTRNPDLLNPFDLRPSAESAAKRPAAVYNF